MESLTARAYDKFWNFILFHSSKPELNEMNIKEIENGRWRKWIKKYQLCKRMKNSIIKIRINTVKCNSLTTAGQTFLQGGLLLQIDWKCVKLFFQTNIHPVNFQWSLRFMTDINVFDTFKVILHPDLFARLVASTKQYSKSWRKENPKLEGEGWFRSQLVSKKLEMWH